MESWNFVSEGKGFASDETIVPTNSLPRSKNGFLGWELRTCSFGNNMFLSGQQDDSTSKLSSSVVDSNSRDSSSIDLKLGRLPDYKDDHFSKFSNGVVPILASSESSRPAKRMRPMGVFSQTAFCQVYGCNKDLNASKDYHKRHKVCEDHSKTAKVIVNGIEQRFCQQCSRFHLLGEFDDGKRSCRKRLAGHNQRRRKPQVGIHSGRAGRLLQSYNDIRSVGSSLSTTSFICQEFLPSGLSHHEKYGTDDWCKPIKVEDGTDYRPLSTIPVTSGKLHSKSLLPHDIGKHFASFHDNGASTATGSTFCENTSQYTNDVGCPTSSSHSLFQNTPLASEDFNVFDAASTVQGLSTISDSGCALSLLSSHSQKPSSHSSGIPMARPLIMPGSHPHYGMSRVSEKFSVIASQDEKFSGIASQDSLSGVSNKFPSSEVNSAEENHLGPILISDNSGAVNFEITDRMFQGSDCLNSDNRHSYESGPTVDLLQLSSQLQRVEHQRQFMQMKQDNDAFCSLRIT